MAGLPGFTEFLSFTWSSLLPGSIPFKNNMRRSKWLSVIAISFFILSCGKALPELEGVDLKAWKDDSNGCQHKRSQMTDAIRKEKNKLLALDELQIVKLFGKPDRNELFKR